MADLERIVEKLRNNIENCVVCRCTVHNLPGQRAVDKDSKESLLGDLDASLYSLHRKLFNSKNQYVKRVNEIITRVEAFKKANSSPYVTAARVGSTMVVNELAGFRLVSKSAIKDYSDYLDTARQELSEAVESLIANYDEVKKDLQASDSLVKYPPAEVVRNARVGQLIFYELGISGSLDDAIRRKQLAVRIDQLLFSMAAGVQETCTTISDALTAMIRAVHTRQQLLVPAGHPLSGLPDPINVLESFEDAENDLHLTIRYEKDGKTITEQIEIPAAEKSSYTLLTVDAVRRRISGSVSENIATLFTVLDPVKEQLGPYSAGLDAVLDDLEKLFKPVQKGDKVTAEEVDAVVRGNSGNKELVKALQELRFSAQDMALGAVHEVEHLRPDVLKEFLDATDD